MNCIALLFYIVFWGALGVSIVTDIACTLNVPPSSHTLGAIIQRSKQQNLNPVDRSKQMFPTNVEIQYVTTLYNIAEIRYTSLH